MHFFPLSPFLRPVLFTILNCCSAQNAMLKMQRAIKTNKKKKKERRKTKQIEKNGASIRQSYPLRLSCSTIPVMYRIVCQNESQPLELFILRIFRSLNAFHCRLGCFFHSRLCNSSHCESCFFLHMCVLCAVRAQISSKYI